MKIDSASHKAGLPAAYPDGPRLLADIGATHARFALEIAAGVIQFVRVLNCIDFAGVVPLLHHYLHDHQDIKIKHAALAVANPIDGDLVRMTNRNWSFSTEAVRRELGLQTLLVVNDFTALAMSLTALSSVERMQIGSGTPVANSVIGLLGPGTGLGVSGLIPTADGFVTLGSEGGHASFAPNDEREYQILRHAWQHWPHVSSERLISGPGMELIYAALYQVEGQIAQPQQLAAPEIMARGLATNPDALCLATLECFCGMLGSMAGNLAVTLGAMGGIFIGGGIVPRMGDWFARSPFRQRFEAKGRFANYVMQIPTYVITSPNPAFSGVASILSEHLRGRGGAHTLLDRVAQVQTELSPAEQRVAALVLEHPRTMLNLPIAEIARQAEVSQPTVIRFCRSLGFLGLADFKLKFASSLTGTIPVRHSQVRLSDSTGDLSAKVIDNTVSAILKFRDQLDVRALDRAIALLRKANRVEFYAVGDARVVALDGRNKFLRFRIPSSCSSDAHLLTMSAELLKAGDVVLVVADNGKLPELLDAVDAARHAGADVIAICSVHSPLAKRANICLMLDHAEESNLYLAMISRILQLLLIDIISVGISLDNQPRTGERVHSEADQRLRISHLAV